jgi:hypothetical protein
MVLLSGSGTGGDIGIYAKLANGVPQYNCTQIALKQLTSDGALAEALERVRGLHSGRGIQHCLGR